MIILLLHFVVVVVVVVCPQSWGQHMSVLSCLDWYVTETTGAIGKFTLLLRAETAAGLQAYHETRLPLLLASIR